ncbi:MAG: dissimilatory-type sulfite reductase subunit alpha [Syntrophomonadaceae bacterium]|nr:dissimilatory-type sulfite reductase subunit alpha [Syntrophomonadaceae bacterium]
MAEHKTPLLDQLESGPWPSFVTEIKRAAKKNAKANDLLGQLENSFVEKTGHWKHGGIVGVRGYGGGVIGRYSFKAEEFPNVAEFHTVRVNQPSGWFYTSEALRTICDVWEKHGSGLTNLHGSTGDIILLGTDTSRLQPCFDDLSDSGFDLGGSGGGLRTPSCCAGPARCEYACIDTLDVTHEITMAFQDYIHRPMWPYKFKIKVAGCANDCVASIARSDFSIIGTWRDNIRVDDAEVKAYADKGFDIFGSVVHKCPTGAMKWDKENAKLTINDEDCVRCMHCINKMTKALRPGKEKGATILVGGKAPVVQGAMLSWVIVPFMKLEPPYEELRELITKVTEWWDEYGKSRERVGELIYRKGMRHFLRDLGLEPVPQMVKEPRTNPYWFWWPEEVNR